MTHDDERSDAEQVLAELDPRPAHEAIPVSRRQTLRALASVGALTSVGSASGQSAGTVVADEAYFSNYGWEPDGSGGGTLTLDGDAYTFDGSEEIGLPDGGVGTELVTPSGQAIELIGPSGQVLWERFGISDSVVYQYRAEDFTTSNWPDAVGTADMSVNGMTDTAFANGAESVDSDGTDDYGLANGPQNLPQNAQFGVAFTIRIDSAPQFSTYFGMGDSSSATSDRFQVRDSGNGNGDIELYIQTGSDQFAVNTSPTYAGDGAVHAVVINKTGNTEADVDFYVDDMTTAVGTDVDSSGTVDPSSYSPQYDMGFYARNDGGTIDRYVDMAAGVFEFNSAPYSQTERESFVSRRPEV